MYKEYDPIINHESILYSIGKLCMPIRNKMGIHAIITYNYDSILEFYLKEMGIKYKTIYNKHEIPPYTKLPIYHVHGYIPYDEKLTQEKKSQ